MSEETKKPYQVTVTYCGDELMLIVRDGMTLIAKEMSPIHARLLAQMLLACAGNAEREGNQ